MNSRRLGKLYLFEIKRLLFLFIIALFIMYISSVNDFKLSLSNLPVTYSSDIFTRTSANTSVIYLPPIRLYFFIINTLWVFALAFIQIPTNTTIWSSLPYILKEIKNVKIIIGILFITFVFILYGAEILFLYHKYSYIYAQFNIITNTDFATMGYKILIYNMFMYYILLVFYYLLIVCCQYICNSRTVGLILGISIILLPMFITNLFGTERILYYSNEAVIKRYMDHISNLLFSNLYNYIKYINYEYNDIKSMGVYLRYPKRMYLTYIILNITAFIFIIKYKPAETNELLNKKWKSYLYIAIISIFVGLFMIFLLGYYIQLRTVLLLFFIFFLAAAIITYYILKKLGAKL